jgi:SAM-dependent methyltransferase
VEARIYEQMAAVEDRHWWFVSRREIFSRLLGRFAPAAGGLIVDLGCGTGGNLGMLRHHGAVVGLEMDPAAAAVAARRGNVVQIDADAGWPLAADAVDVVTAYDVLEHIEDEQQVLRRVHATLKPGGRLILSVPAYQWLWSAHDDVLHHLRRYRSSDLAALAAATGFEVEYLSYHNLVLLPVAMVTRVLSRLLGGAVADENRVPPRPVNALLRMVYSAERHLLGRGWRLPFGLSIVAVLKRPRN